jgi:hypothetical protein
MELLLALVALFSLVGLFVSAPLGKAGAAAALVEDRHAELEAAKEAKYREIRDARLDFKMGKVSPADHEATERELQAQAMEIVRELESLRVPATA